MGRSFDGEVYFGKAKNKVAKTDGVARLLNEAVRAIAEALPDEPLAAEIGRKLLKLAPSLEDALVPLGGAALLRVGVSRGDLIVHLKSSDQHVREEAFYVVKRGFAAGQALPAEKLVVLQPDDPVIQADAPKFQAQLGAKLRSVEKWQKTGAKPVAVDQAIGLFAHGSRDCPDRNLIVGTTLAGKDAKAIADLVRPRLPPGYRGTISLYGCFTGSGKAFGATDLAFAKQVHNQLKAEFAAVRVRGVPDSWKLDDQGQMKLANHVVVDKESAPGLTTKPIEQSPAYLQARAKSDAAWYKASELFDAFAGPALAGLYNAKEGWWEANKWGIDDWGAFVANVDKVAAQYPKAQEVAERYAIMLKAKELADKIAMRVPDVRNLTRTFRDKPGK